MPFVSKQQMRACYAQRSAAIREGRPVTWDCDEFARETEDKKKLPLYKAPRKLYLGERGGLYYKTNTGRKVYVDPKQVVESRREGVRNTRRNMRAIDM